MEILEQTIIKNHNKTVISAEAKRHLTDPAQLLKCNRLATEGDVLSLIKRTGLHGRSAGKALEPFMPPN